jgi:polyhydroxyalkanoate synthase
MADTPSLPNVDPEKLQQSLSQIAERSAAVAQKFLESQPQLELMQNLEDLGINQAFMELGQKLLADPAKLAEMQMRAWDDYLKLWTATFAKAQGQPTEPVKQPGKGDNRFRGEMWENNFLFDYIKQSYLIAADTMQRAVAETKGLDRNTARKVQFFTRQYVDMLSPTNFAVTNPDVLKATAESGGQNLLQGLNNMLKDLDRGRGKLAISMTDYDAFKLGENVATTPGKVVFRNDLMELLQYEPTTPQVDRTPLLIVPPWINKYYILDLRAKNSFIKWAVDRGLTVFVISWVNPDSSAAHKTFHDYLLEGPLAAMEAIREATGEAAVNLIGYCLGGTLTACLMSWLQSRGQSKRVKSVTYFTTMIDFAEPGELGVFVDEQSVDNLEKRMAARGFLEGEEMAGTFNLLRDNDLVWSFVVNNYLLGKEPFPFDLLYWNSDATRMPAKMHTFYLRNMYIANKLREPGAMTVAGEAIDLSKVETPTYFISTMEDHIAPWKSTYAGARLFTGPVRFVLGGSGHIAGIVNPPVAQKYCFWTNEQMPQDADLWLSSAERHEGSWWNDWGAWVSGFGGGKVKARIPGDGGLRVLEAAPGSYAKMRLDAAPAVAAPAKAPVATAPAPTVVPTPARAAEPPPAPPALAKAPAAKRATPARRKPIAKAPPSQPRKVEAAPEPAPVKKASAKKKAPAAKSKPAAVVKAKPVAAPVAKPVAAPEVKTSAKSREAAPVPKAKSAKVATPPAKTAKKKGAVPSPASGSSAMAISALFRNQGKPAAGSANAAPAEKPAAKSRRK